MRCVICPRPRVGIALCAPCAKSYDRTSRNIEAEVIAWAAARARRFERKRAKDRIGRFAALVKRQDAKR